MHHPVDLVPAVVVRRDDETLFRRLKVIFDHSFQPYGAVRDFVDAPLLLEAVNRFFDMVSSEQINRLLQLRVVLTDDFFQAHGSHPGLLELLKRPSGFDRLMLPDVTDQQHAVLHPKALEELIHLLGARQARFIENVKPARRRFCLLAPYQKLLQGAGPDTGTLKQADGSRGGGEALNLVPLGFGGATDGGERGGFACTGSALKPGNAVGAVEDLHYRLALSRI